MEERLGKHGRRAHNSQSVQVGDSCPGHSWSITLMIPRRLSSETLKSLVRPGSEPPWSGGHQSGVTPHAQQDPVSDTPIDEYLCSLGARVYTDGVETQGDFRVSSSLYEMYVASQPYALIEAISVSMRCMSFLSSTLSLSRFQSLCDVCRLSALRSR